MKWKVLHSEYLFNQPWLTVRKDHCLLPNGKEIPAFYVNEYPEWVNVFALTDEGNVVMVKQYRHGIEQVSIELPGGVAEKGEDLLEACQRELLEETGYEFEQWEFLGKVCANPSTTNNFTHFFLATKGRKVAAQNLDEEEDLEVLELPVEEVKRMALDNEIVQSLHTNGIFYALLRLNKMG
ncbi:NUDIX hydrolase [Paracnuella aquatica]|uniref:NUDIX hydrolase n=1 Tax=Paracnuella aquatica TaxID=2268757 RepID=UPI000DEF1DD6|nr:NUDIX hydrolase [Paracnuella aquatica]RPD51374.1 NUDIX hydrolase [Paracnuella aquatica]